MITADVIKSNHKKYLEREKEKYKEFIDKGLNIYEARFISEKLTTMELDSETEGKEKFTFMISEPYIKVKDIEDMLVYLGFFVKTEWVSSISMYKITIATRMELL